MEVMPAPLRVLYVDDEPSLLKIAKLFLEREGEFVIETLSSASAALEQLSTDRFDAIVSDYQMPEIDGIVFLKKLKASGNTTPFIIFTGKGREEVVIEALNEGAEFYLQKGGEPKAQFTELAHKIRSAVSRQWTEKLAKDTERRLYDIINFLPDAMFAIDNEGHVIAWNRAIEEMTGVAARDMLGRGNYEYAIPFYGERRPILIDLISTPDEELTRDKYAVIKKEGDILIAETTLPRPLGRYSVLLGKASHLFNNEGNIVGAIESIRDVTDLKRSEEELRAANEQLTSSGEQLEAQFKELLQSEQLLKTSEEKYRVVVENSHDAIYIYRENKFLFINRMASDLTGFDRDELIEKEVWDLIHPDDRARLKESGMRRMDGDELSTSFSARILTKNGEVKYGDFFVDRVIYQGQPAILGIVKDITEQRTADEALRQSEAIYRAIFSHTGSATIIIEEDMTISFANPEFERITGYSKEEVEGKKQWTEFVVPEDIGQMVKYHQLRRTDSQNVPKNYEFRFITRERQVRDAYIIIGLIPGTSKTVASFVDITGHKKAQEALKASEKTYRSILENIQDTYYRSDQEGNIIMISPSGVRLLGYESESGVLGKNIATTFYADPLQREKILEVLDREGLVKDFEVDLQKCDGSLVTVETNSHKYYDEDGNFLGVEGLFRNITKRKQIIKSLAESEAKFRSIFENMQDAFYRTDLEGNLVLFSESGAKKAGYNSAAEMIGLNIAEVIYLDPAERSTFLAALYKSGKVDNYPLALKTSSGTLHNILANSHLYFDDSGRVLGVEGVLHDITDLMVAEEEIRKRDTKLRILVEASANVIWEVDLSGNLTFVSPQIKDLIGYAPEEMVGRPIYDFIPPEDLGSITDIFGTHIREKTTSHPFNIRVQHRDGHNIELEIRPVVLFDDSGEIMGVGGIALDITGRKKAEESYRLVNKKLKLLSGITRHDINNQIFALNGFLELLHTQVQDPALEEYFTMITKASGRISAMIRFSKEYEQIGTFSPFWQDCHELVDSAAQQVTHGQIRIINDLPVGEEVFADPMIARVFFNLVDNAVRYGGKISSIRFSAEKANGNLVIICEDDGEGVHAGEKEKIFDRGYGKNSGMGLFLSREILANTGITIRETGEPEKWARFEIIVPKGMYR